MNLKTFFYLVVLIAIFLIGLKLVPVYYKGYISVPGVCKEAAESYKKYGPEFVMRDIGERLDNLGIGGPQREVHLDKQGEDIMITITYDETVDFWGKYQRDFHFEKVCTGKTSSIYYRRYK
jgi:hypothetical protein